MITVIAEAGVNHNGDINQAEAMIAAAAQAGADVVKFQAFSSAELVAQGTATAGYQRSNTGESDQSALLKRLELGAADFARLGKVCREHGIEFLCTAFDLSMLGGDANATASAGGDVAKAFSVASMQAANISIMGVGGGANHSNMLLQGGTANATVTAGGALSSADALIVATRSKTVSIGGNLVLNGGTTTRSGSGVVSATASIDPSQLTITTGGNVVLQAGTGTNADAHITNEGDIVMNINGNASFSYSNLGFGTTPTVGPGLIVIGNAPASGLFDGTNGKLDGHSLPIQLKFGGGGSYQLATDSGRGTAYVQTGVLPGFDTSLINYIIFAANEETRTSRVRAGLGSGDDSSAPSCN